MKKSLRVYLVRHHDGRMTGILMRWRETFFDLPTPTAYGDSAEEIFGQLETRLTERLARGADQIDRYLWDEDFATRLATVVVHPQTQQNKRSVIGKKETPLRLTYAWAKMAGGNYRVMLPRFGWWFILESLEVAPEVLRSAVSSGLLGEQARWVYDFRLQGEETVRDHAPRWLERAEELQPTDDGEGETELPTVRQVADEWVERAARAKLAPVVGEPDPTFWRLTNLVERPKLPSILLVGEAGAGKTTWVRRLARTLLQWKRNGTLTRRLWATNADRLLAGMVYLGMWQERCLKIAAELAHEGDLLYVDRLTGMLAAQSDGSSIFELWLPALAAGEMAVLAECSPAELERCRRRFPRLIDLFQIVEVPPADVRAMPALMELYQNKKSSSVRLHAAGHTRVAQHLDVFERGTAFPGKALRFLDWLAEESGRGAARLYYAREASAAYSRYSGLPVGLIADDEPTPPARIEAELAARVIGQRAAVAQAAGVLARFQTRLNDPERPVGSLFFVGPTGVGKTELARQLARLMFGDAERMVRIDMSEYMFPGSAARLTDLGARGTSLAARVHERPLSLVLFDEVEKAHPEVFDLLLGVLGEGRLSDELGRLVDFRGTLIVMTSNLGAGAAPAPGFTQGADAVAVDALAAVRRHFRPEFFNRIDAVVPFSPLAIEDVARIVDLELDKVLARVGLMRRGIALDVGAAARALLARLGYSPLHGARPLKRVIEERLVTPLAVRMAADPNLRDRRLSLDIVGDELVLR